MLISVTDLNRTQALSSDPNPTMMGVAPTLDATVTIKPVQCPVCKTFNPAGMMFCIDCGLIFDRALPDDAFGAPAIQLPMLVDSSGREHPVRQGVNVLGREGDIAIPDPRISRRHAQIVFADGGFTVEDLGSTNGTTLNGAPVTGKVPFGPSDTLAFGGAETRLQLPGAVGAGVTQAIPTNRTTALSAPPKVEAAPAVLIVGDLRFALNLGENSFGRKPENAIQLSDPYVSGRHGIFEVTPDGVFVTDIGSTNGTVLNDAKIPANTRTRVTPEDLIRLGSMQLSIEMA